MHIFYVYKINSTQDHAKALSELHLGAVSFWLRSATQMHGRGQRGRKWESELGNLYLTGCFEKQNIVPGQLSIGTGVFLANILKAHLAKIDGATDGLAEGCCEGCAVGCELGCLLGWPVGRREGCPVG